MKKFFLSVFVVLLNVMLYGNVTNSIFSNNAYIKKLNNLEQYLDDILLPDYWHTIRKAEANTKIHISGMSRFNFVYYYLQRNPSGVTNKSFFYTHTPSYEPNLKFDVWANPSDSVGIGFSFGFNISFDKNYSTSFQLANNYIFYLNLENKLGKQFIRIGGPEWRVLTPFSFSTPGWQWTIYPFERNSWDNIWMSYWKYKNLTTAGNIEFNSRSEGAPGAKGFYLDWWQGPFDLHLTGFYGKLDNSSIFYQNSSYDAFFLIEKYFSLLKIGFADKTHILNTSNSYSGEGFNENRAFFIDIYPMSIGKFYIEYGESLLKYNSNKMYKGNAFLLDYKKNILDMGIFNKINMNISSYYITPNFVGEYTGVFHIVKPQSDYPLTYFSENAMGNFNLFNNMYGLNTVTEFELFNFKLTLNYSISKTIKSTTNIVNYPHSLNHSIWYVIYSSIEPWCHGNYFSYYNTSSHFLNTYWEGASETVYLSDSRKHNRYFDYFNISTGINLSKYIKFLSESFIFLNYSQKTMWNKYSFVLLAQNKYRPVFGGNSSNIFIAQQIANGLYILLFKGVENWYSVNTIIKINQKDSSFGGGIDYVFNSNSALFLKIRKYYFTDETFTQNNMDGIKSSIEWKFQF